MLYRRSITLKKINSNFDTGESCIPEIGGIEKNHAQASKKFLRRNASLLNPNTIQNWLLKIFTISGNTENTVCDASDSDYWRKKTLKLVEFLIFVFFHNFFAFSKSTGGEQPGRIFLNSLVYVCVYVFMYLFIYVFVCVTSPGHTNNDTDLKFGTHTPIDLI